MIRRIRGSQFAREFLFGSPGRPAAIDSATGALANVGGQTVVRDPLRAEAARRAAVDDPIRSVMVALDGSPAAEHALPYALALADRCGAEVWLVHVHSPFDGAEPWEHFLNVETVRRRKRAKRDYLAGLAHRVAMATGRSVGLHVVDDPDVEGSLVRAADEFDLVVMTARPRGFWSRIWRRGVSDRFIRRTRRPVLLVPAPAGKGAGRVDLSAAPSVRNILTPLDGSLEAETALPLACRFAEAFEGSLTLVNVQDPAWTSGSFDHTTPTGYLRGQVADLFRRDVAAKAYVVTASGDAGSAVARFADQRRADLIALARPCAGVRDRLFGRCVASSLVRELPLPLLLAATKTEAERPAVTTVVE